MGIPGSRLNELVPFPEALASNLAEDVYPDRCSFYARSTSTQTSGQKKPTYTLMDTAHRNLPCRLVPLILVRPQKQEDAREPLVMKDAKYQLSFPTAVVGINLEDRVGLGSKFYRVLSIEGDGNGITYRLMLGDSEPFGG